MEPNRKGAKYSLIFLIPEPCSLPASILINFNVRIKIFMSKHSDHIWNYVQQYRPYEQHNTVHNIHLDQIYQIYIYMGLNHPYGTFSKFPEQAKEK